MNTNSRKENKNFSKTKMKQKCKQFLLMFLCSLMVLESTVPFSSYNVASVYAEETGDGRETPISPTPTPTITETPTPTLTPEPIPADGGTETPTDVPTPTPTPIIEDGGLDGDGLPTPTPTITDIPTPVPTPKDSGSDDGSDGVAVIATDYVITYHLNGGDYNGNTDTYAITGAENDEITLLTSSEIIAPSTNMVFGGWYLAEDFSEGLLGSTHILTEDIDVYAKWNESFTITYHLNGGDYDGNTDTFSITKEKNTEITLLTSEEIIAPSEDRAFGGWYLAEDFSDSALGSTHTLTENIDIYAKWDELYLVRYHLNGGSYKGSTNDYVEKVTPGQEIPLIIKEALTYIDMRFYGWYTTPDFSGSPLSGNYKPTESVDLYAKWGIQEYVNLTFYLNNNSGMKTMEMPNVPCGGTEYFPVVTKTGYKIQGWYLNQSLDKDYNNEGLDTSNQGTTTFIIPETSQNYYAKWEVDPNADVTVINFEPNITIPGILWNTENNYQYIFCEKNENYFNKLINPNAAGYTFKGWYYDKACTNQVTNANAIGDASKTIYAKFEENKIIVKINIPSGVQLIQNGKPTTVSSYQVTIGNGEFLTLPIAYKQNYKYNGWTCTEDGKLYEEEILGNSETPILNITPNFTDGRDIALLTCIKSRPVHYANVEDKNSRCPYCGHTTYEVLWCAVNADSYASFWCSNSFQNQNHKYTTIDPNAKCINKEPNTGFYSCFQTPLKTAVYAVFPDQAVPFAYACTGAYNHNFVSSSNGNVCSICGLSEAKYIEEYKKANTETPNYEPGAYYAGKLSEYGGPDTVPTVEYKGWNSRKSRSIHGNVCFNTSCSGNQKVTSSDIPACSTCGATRDMYIYNGPNNGYCEVSCWYGCGAMWQGADCGSHPCRGTRRKAYHLYFNQNVGYPTNSKGERPSTASGGTSGGKYEYGYTHRAASINNWTGYLTDHWMNTSTMISGRTRYLPSGATFYRLVADGGNMTLYARHIPYTYNVNFNFNLPESSSSSIKTKNGILNSSIKNTKGTVHFDDYLTSALNTTDSNLDGQYIASLSLEGWIFKGWSSKADGSGTLLKSTDRLTVTTMNNVFGGVKANNSTLNLYAVWVPARTKFVFNANNVAKTNEYGTPSIENPAAMPVAYENYDNGSVVLTNKYSRVYTTYYGKKVNYVFMGWLMGAVTDNDAVATNNTSILPQYVARGGTPITNKVRYQNVSESTTTSINSLMNGTINLTQSNYGNFVISKLAPRYGALVDYARTYDGANIGTTRWDYGYVATKSKSSTKSVRFNYQQNTSYVTFYDGDNNYFRNIPDGAFASYNAADNPNVTKKNYGGTTTVQLYATWAAYNTRPQGFFRLAVKEFNQDGTFTGRLVDYKDDSFYGNKTSGNPVGGDNPSKAVTVYDDAYVYLHAAYYDPEQMEKGGEEYQFSVDGGNTWYLLQSGISNKYFDCVATTYANENIKSDTASSTTGFVSNEISGPSSGKVYKIHFKTTNNKQDQQVLLRYRVKDTIRYGTYYANVNNYENGITSELQKVLWSTGYYDNVAGMNNYESATLEGQTLKKYKGDTQTADTLTKANGEKSNNSNENGSWATKTITIKDGNDIPQVGLNGSNTRKPFYDNLSIETAIPMYDYYTGVKAGNEAYTYTNGRIYLLVSQAEENAINNDSSLASISGFANKVKTARGLDRYSNVVVIRESQYKSFIHTGDSLSYNSQTLLTDDSGTKTNVSGSQYTKYVPGDETVAFLDTSNDADNNPKNFGLYFISIIDKDSMSDVLYSSSDTAASQNETTTGKANTLGQEQYASAKTITNGMTYIYKNSTLKTADNTVGVKGHIFTSYNAMVKFVYDRVKAEFPEVSDLYNGQYVIFYAVCDGSWNNMSPSKWSTICTQNFETQPRLTVLDTYVSSIGDAQNRIENPVSLWKHTNGSGSPLWRLSGYTIAFNPSSGVSAYRGSKTTNANSNRYAITNERNAQSNTNYGYAPGYDGKVPTSYNVTAGYMISYDIETLGADFIEVNLSQKGTHKPLTISVQDDINAKFDRKYASDTTKREQYMLAYSIRPATKTSFVYANLPQSTTNASYGYFVRLTKKSITKPNTYLQRSFTIGEYSTLSGNPSIIEIGDSVVKDVGISVTN